MVYGSFVLLLRIRDVGISFPVNSNAFISQFPCLEKPFLAETSLQGHIGEADKPSNEAIYRAVSF